MRTGRSCFFLSLLSLVPAKRQHQSRDFEKSHPLVEKQVSGSGGVQCVLRERHCICSQDALLRHKLSDRGCGSLSMLYTTVLLSESGIPKPVRADRASISHWVECSFGVFYVPYKSLTK